MFCRNCSNQVADAAVLCPKCGYDPKYGSAYCWQCGQGTNPAAVACTNCGVSLAGYSGGSVAGADKKLAAGLCGILLGALGVHKFILGYNTAGIIMLAVTVFTCGFGGMVTGLIGLIEGIIYLTKSDAEFVNLYVTNKKEWF